jgi:hypothetical protein
MLNRKMEEVKVTKIYCKHFVNGIIYRNYKHNMLIKKIYSTQ